MHSFSSHRLNGEDSKDTEEVPWWLSGSAEESQPAASCSAGSWGFLLPPPVLLILTNTEMRKVRGFQKKEILTPWRTDGDCWDPGQGHGLIISVTPM